MCVFLLSDDNYENLLLKKKSKQRWDAIRFTAMSGSEQIFDLLEKRWTQQLKKTDAHGWNIAHFAAMVGNKDLFKLIQAFRLEKTRRKKTVLHICCKYGHEDLSDKIIKTSRSILHDVDDEEWNALHYAAKGGGLLRFT